MSSRDGTVSRRLVTVHAHPDDESSKGAASVAKYVGDGVRAVLVTCTGGEEGEVLNPAADTEEARNDLASVRLRELAEAVSIIGYSASYRLGYRDSGMQARSADCFASVDPARPAHDLVGIIRRERPQVVVTYDREYAERHPDHLRCYDVTVRAFHAAADPAVETDAPPWTPSKLYGIRSFSSSKMRALHDWLVAAGKTSPFSTSLSREATDAVHARVPVADHLEVARRALLAHRTQISPDDFWFWVPAEVLRTIYPWDDYQRIIPAPSTDSVDEDDLFAGLDL